MGMFVVAPAGSFNHHHLHHQHQHHHQHDSSGSFNLVSGVHDTITSANAATALGVGVGVGVIPLLTAAPCLPPQNMDDQDLLNNGRNKISGIQFWQNQNPYNNNNNNIKKSSILDHNNSVNFFQTGINNSGGGGGGGSGGGGGGGNSASSSTTTCQDCGNQAKKDCTHNRCRTCCKSRGYDCNTHVRSTWVPAARRRERQLITTAAGGGSSGSTSGVKKPRLINSQQTTATSHTSTSNTTPPRSFDTGSSQQDVSYKESLPGQVRAPAVFKCVRVTAMDDGEDEYAYQAVVKIGGHVFKGFLYDQGVETTRDGFPNLSELHLGGGGGGTTGGGGGLSSSPIVDPSDVYGASGGGFLGGSAYGNPIN